MKEEKLSIDSALIPITLFLAAVTCMTLLIGALVAILICIFCDRYLLNIKIRLAIGALFFVFSLGTYLWFRFSNEYIAYAGGINFLVMGFAFIFTHPILKAQKKKDALKRGISVAALKGRADKSIIKSHDMLSDPKRVTIGISKISGDIIALEEGRRKMHVIFFGATGMGKSETMMSLVLHAARYNQPCVIIDPKPDSDAIHDLYEMVGKIHGTTKKIRVFDFTDPKFSAKYNPIANGSAVDIKDRIMASLKWSEQYFESVAADYLMAVLPAIIFLGYKPCFKILCDMIRSDGFKSKIMGELKKVAENDPSALRLLENLIGLKRYDDKQLSGLAAQLSIFENQEFGSLFSVSENDANVIDLAESYINNEIVYFKLNTLGNGHTAKRLGALILEDLKALCNRIYSGEFEKHGPRKFYPIFVDEFGAFATINFLDFLKQCRGAGFALHLFTQGLEDLDAVDKNFRRQVLSNPLTKIILRMDDAEGVEQVVNSIGTHDQLEQSHQVESSMFGVVRSGMGNQRETKSVLVAHDVFKQLGVGQAVLFEKSPSRQDLIELLRPSEILASHFAVRSKRGSNILAFLFRRLQVAEINS